MNDIRDMREAMRDVQRAYFVAPIGNGSLDQAMSFAIAAEEARLEHVVALGQWLSSPRHPSLLTRRTWQIDRLMAWIPGVAHTVINVGWFADNYMPLFGMAAQLGAFPLGIGSGATAPVSNEDIGSVVAGVLMDPSPYAGRMLRPTGPELLSPQEVADAFGEVLGRKVRYFDVSDRMLSKTLRALGVDPFRRAQGLNYMREYRRGAFAIDAPNDVVQQVTGRPAEDLISIVRRYAASDPSARRSIPNTIRALAQMVRVAVTPPMDVPRYEAMLEMPRIAAAEDCVDAAEWNSTHALPNAFGVAHNDYPGPLLPQA